MATIATRINSSGTFFVNGSFNEITYNRTSPVIKNLLRYTEDFSQWANVGHTVTLNQTTAPNGTLTADRIQATTGSGGDYTAILNNPTVGGASYTFSFWVKSVSGSSGTWGVNYYNGAHNRTTVPITGEWSRRYITFTGTGAQINVYIADNRSSLASITDAYVWGAQLERGTTPTIYQGIAAADTLITPNFSINVTTNTVYVTNIFDEVTLEPPPPLTLTGAGVDAVFVGLYGNGGTGVPGVPVELGFNSGGTDFPGTIAADLVPRGSRVYVRWTWCAYTGSSYNALVDMGTVSAVVKNGDNSYVMVSNPNGVSRPFYLPDAVSGFINSAIVAYDANEVYIEYPPPIERRTSTGTLLVSGYFNEVGGMIATDRLLLQLDPGKVESFRSTSTSFIDISGNTRNCSFTGGITYDSTSSSLLFDTPTVTASNRISLASLEGVDNTIYFTDGSEYSIEFWCKIASDAIQTYHSIAGRNSTNPWLGIEKRATDFRLFFRQLGGTYFYSTSINTSVFTGWTQVVFSVNANRDVSYYVNHAAGTFTDTDAVTTSTFTISRLAAGYSSGGNFYAFDGNVGPINVYSKALSAAEVNNNFEALRNRFGI